jgi:hypothetical protein
LGQCRFEVRDLGAQNELAMRQDVVDAAPDPRLKRPELGLEIDKLHREYLCELP